MDLRGDKNMDTWICQATLAAAVACLTLMTSGMVQPQNGVAITKFGGQGTFTQEDFVVIGGAPASSGFATAETGTYAVSSDCTGTATINYLDVRGSIWSSW
jgi:hypothetical protein